MPSWIGQLTERSSRARSSISRPALDRGARVVGVVAHQGTQTGEGQRADRRPPGAPCVSARARAIEASLHQPRIEPGNSAVWRLRHAERELLEPADRRRSPIDEARIRAWSTLLAAARARSSIIIAQLAQIHDGDGHAGEVAAERASTPDRVEARGAAQWRGAIRRFGAPTRTTARAVLVRPVEIFQRRQSGVAAAIS